MTVLTLTIPGFMMAGVWNGNWSSIGWHEGWEKNPMTLSQAHILGKFRSPCNKQSETV